MSDLRAPALTREILDLACDRARDLHHIAQGQARRDEAHEAGHGGTFDCCTHDRCARVAAAAGLDAAPPLDKAAFARCVQEAMVYVNKIVVDSDGYPQLHSAADVRTLLVNAYLTGLDAALAHPPQVEMKGEKS